jgi:hypothetical protein
MADLSGKLPGSRGRKMAITFYRSISGKSRAFREADGRRSDTLIYRRGLETFAARIFPEG